MQTVAVELAQCLGISDKQYRQEEGDTDETRLTIITDTARCQIYRVHGPSS